MIVTKPTAHGAIWQRDGQSIAVLPRFPAGLITAEQLERVARVIRDHHIPVVKITSGQRLALVGLKPEQLDAIRADLGIELGPGDERSVHYVQACPGTDTCTLGQLDSLALGRRLDALLVGVETPAKVKVGVSGCAMCCAESRVRDIGVFATTKGWTVTFGGNSGARPRIGDVVAKGLDDDGVVDLVQRLLEVYKRHANGAKRTARVVERVGIETIKRELGLS